MSEPMKVVQREVGSGVPLLPWKVSRYYSHGEYEGHAFVTADPMFSRRGLQPWSAKVRRYCR